MLLYIALFRVLYTLCPTSSVNNISYKRLVLSQKPWTIFFWATVSPLLFTTFRHITSKKITNYIYIFIVLHTYALCPSTCFIGSLTNTHNSTSNTLILTSTIWGTNILTYQQTFFIFLISYTSILCPVTCIIWIKHTQFDSDYNYFK